MKGNKLFLCALLLLGGVKGFSQDPLYTQFYFNSIYTNPSLAGSNHSGTRFIANQRNQWYKIPGLLSTSTFNIDTKCIGGSSIGLFIYKDIEGERFMSQSGGSFLYSWGGSTYKRNLMFRFGFKAGIYQKTINWDKFVFYDQLDPIYGKIYTSNIPIPKFSTGPIGDVSFGGSILFTPLKHQNAGIHMFGFAFEHLYSGSESFYIGDYNLPVIFSFQFNNLLPSKINQNFLSSPYFRFTMDFDRQFTNLDGGYNVFMGPLTCGLGVKSAIFKRSSRNINHGVFLIGWTNYKRNFMISYSNDFPFSGIPASTVITSELNLILILDGGIFPQNGGYNKSGGSNKCEDFYRRGKTVVIW